MRWCFLLLAFLNAAVMVTLIATSPAPLEVRGLGIAGALFMCWHWRRAYRLGRFDATGDVLTGIALLLVGFGAGDPLRCAVLIYPGLFLEAMFVTRRRLVLATAIELGAYAVALAISPTRDELNPWSPTVALQPGGVAMVAVMHVLARAIARHERAATRERALARVGSALVASTDRHGVFAAALEGVRAVVAPHAEADAVLGVGDADHLKIIGATTANAERLRDVVIDLNRVPVLRDPLLRGDPYEARAEEINAVRSALGLKGPSETALVIPLRAGETLCGMMAVMTQASLPDECKDGLLAMATEVALALENLALREQLARQAFYDALTGLANRALLTDRLEHALTRLGRHEGHLGVLLLDVDGFQTVNDSLGHPAGDRVLGEVARRLESCLRESDTAARLGGDEFLVLLEDLDEAGPEAAAEAVAERILEALRVPFVLPSTEVFVSGSIGIALGQSGDDVEELLSQADVAMYAAKRSGKSRANVFEPSLRSSVVQRLALETDLRRALEADQFMLQYQPIVDVQTLGPIGYEALVRWNHPRHGLVAPEEFVPLAEETGLIVPLGRWILEEACQQLVAWHASSEVTMHVNVAVRQLREPGFVDDVRGVLARTGVNPSALVLEVTETGLIQRSDATLALLHELRTLGVRLALDDFGTGYSSLAYLRDLPFDSVKIDKSFVTGLLPGSAQASLVRAIVDVSAALQLKTVAEGVETPAQAELLRRLGCDMAQGFLFAQPGDVSSIEERAA